jgi:hypothetical protein
MTSTHAAVYDVWRSISIVGGLGLFAFLGVVAVIFKRQWAPSAALATAAYMVALAYMVADQASRFGSGDLTWRLPLFILSELLGAYGLRLLVKRKNLINGLAGDAK